MRRSADLADVFECNGDEAVPFFTPFYNEFDPAAAVITYGEDQTIAIAAPAAAGIPPRTWNTGSTRVRRTSTGMARA